MGSSIESEDLTTPSETPCNETSPPPLESIAALQPIKVVTRRPSPPHAKPGPQPEETEIECPVCCMFFCEPVSGLMRISACQILHDESWFCRLSLPASTAFASIALEKSNGFKGMAARFAAPNGVCTFMSHRHTTTLAASSSTHQRLLTQAPTLSLVTRAQ